MSGPIITIFVRHKPGCKWHGDEFTKQCRCRKHLRWSLKGKQFRKQAGTRSWAEAEEAKVRLAVQLGGNPAAPSIVMPDKQTIRAAVDVFVKAKEVRQISARAVKCYRIQLTRFVEFCERAGVFAVDAIDLVLLLNFKATWPRFYASSNTQFIAQKRLSGFLHFCKDAGWLHRIPKLDPVKVTEPPTLPITDAEYKNLLKAATGRTRAIIQLMRWSGLAVRDASCLRADALQKSPSGTYRVSAARQKTGVRIQVPIPPAIAEEILHAANTGPYLFWNPASCTAGSMATMTTTAITEAFRKAKIHTVGHMVSHRLRDTFAVDLLCKGVPMEEVSKLLGHESIRTTEKHYAQWAKGRQDRVDELVSGTWE